MVEAAFAGKPRSYRQGWVHPAEIGRLSGRLREQARSHSWVSSVHRARSTTTQQAER